MKPFSPEIYIPDRSSPKHFSPVEPTPTLQPDNHVLSDINTILDRIHLFLKETAEGRLVISGVSPELFRNLQARVEQNEIPGFERLRIDYIPNTLILRYPSTTDGISQLLFNLGCNPSHFVDLMPIVPYGSTDIPMADSGAKSPDFSVVDASFSWAHPSSKLGGVPTVVWEVAYSKTKKKLAEDCGQWIVLSDGGVQLANGIDIEYAGKDGPVEELTWTFWELETEILDSVEDGQVLSALVREDHGNDPPQFHSFRHLADEVYIKYIARATHVFKILPPNSQCPKTIEILHRHVFRNPPDDKAHLPYYSYNVQAIRDAVAVLRRAHISLAEKRQLQKEGVANSVPDIEEALQQVAKFKKNKISNANT